MASNKTYTWRMAYVYKEEGNRATPDFREVKSTTVQRATSKLARELNTNEDGTVLQKTDPDFVKATDLMILEAKNITPGWSV